METIYFLLIISAVFVASIFIVRKINARSYLVGGKIDKVKLELEQVKKQLHDQSPVSRQELDYVEWFEARNSPTMAELAREADEELEYMGVAMMADGHQPQSSKSSLQAMH